MSNKGDLTIRQAAVVAGFAYLLNPVPYAEFSLMPKLVVSGHIDQTVANISAQSSVLLTAIFCYLACFIGDIVIAWALYFLLAPVNRAVSALAALFRLVYTTVGVVAMFKLVTVYHLVATPDYVKLFGPTELQGNVDLLLRSFRYEWSMSLVIFTLHLFGIAWLVYRSGYLWKFWGPILALDALCLDIVLLRPYLWPQANVDWLFYITFAELVFGLWLLVTGWRMREPTPGTQSSF